MDTAIEWEQARAQRSRLRILEAALAAFQTRGFEHATFREIAAEAGISVGLVCRYYPTKEHVALALYDQLASELEGVLPELPVGTLVDRFEVVMRRKLVLLEPRRSALVPMFGRALDPQARAGVLGDAAAGVRSKVLAIFHAVVAGASDAPAHPAAIAELLYGIHLLLVLVWIQDRTPNASLADGAVGLVVDLVRLGAPMLAAGRVPPALANRLAKLSSGLLSVARAGASGEVVARRVAARLFRDRRVHGEVRAPSEAALAPHLARILDFVARGEPIDLVLPAFPAKSPNPTKVLGRLTDLGEQLGVQALAALCTDLAAIYAPGARLILCSDGHVFGDVVGVTDKHIAQYRAALEDIVAESGGGRIRIFGLEDAFDARPVEARASLLELYGSTIDEIRARATASPAHRTQLEGIHRFLTEDELGLHPQHTRSHAQKLTRERAYEVVRRSDAWSRLIAAVFPRAVRLSIHPQPEVSDKIGIHLLPTHDAWLTPWHGCVLIAGDRFELVKRNAAEARGAIVVEQGGRPSHLEVLA